MEDVLINWLILIIQQTQKYVFNPKLNKQAFSEENKGNCVVLQDQFSYSLSLVCLGIKKKISQWSSSPKWQSAPSNISLSICTSLCKLNSCQSVSWG